MLSFFHSLNALLWYDTPSLRDLVILDVQWVIDAATCFIRNFKLDDHTSKHERLRPIDQRAQREQEEAWALLTEGDATLQKKLLDVLWSAPEFASAAGELLRLMLRVSLLVPLPSRPTDFLVPALLPTAPAAQATPAVQGAAQLRLFFYLQSEADGAGRLRWPLGDFGLATPLRRLPSGDYPLGDSPQATPLLGDSP